MGKILLFVFLLAMPAFAEETPTEIETLREQRLALLQDQQQLLEKVAALEKALQDISLMTEEKKAQIEQHKGDIVKQLPLLTRLGRSNPLRLLTDPRMTQNAVRGIVLLRALGVSLKHRMNAIQAEVNELASLSKDFEIKNQDHRALLQAIEAHQAQLKLVETQRIDELKQEEEGRLAGEDDVATLLEESRTARSKTAKKVKAATIAKGLPFRRLEQPVSGKIKTDSKLQKKFSPQGQGIIFETQKNADVFAPSKGTVVFKGPFRSQEEILILDHGKHVHTVFMGMHKISAEVGQTVYAGERLGTMAGYGKSPPLLYIELRQKGKAIDPKPYFPLSSSDTE
ncbi:MAG: peptidoglycan DD-metalloendopeptidase family protein [Proteobacteria bacterium]|nr:peptidoglycan DD-metalloendopeptidase family protein [Pseudomonadota bacterium]